MNCLLLCLPSTVRLVCEYTKWTHIIAMVIILNFHGYKEPWLVTEKAKSSFHGNNIEISVTMAHSYDSGRYKEPRFSYSLAGRAMSKSADETEFLKNLPNSWHEFSQWNFMKLLSVQKVPMLRSVLQCYRLHLSSLLFRNMCICGANTQTVI
jgi:hypothetical protein